MSDREKYDNIVHFVRQGNNTEAQLHIESLSRLNMCNLIDYVYIDLCDSELAIKICKLSNSERNILIDEIVEGTYFKGIQ